MDWLHERRKKEVTIWQTRPNCPTFKTAWSRDLISTGEKSRYLKNQTQCANHFWFTGLGGNLKGVNDHEEHIICSERDSETIFDDERDDEVLMSDSNWTIWSSAPLKLLLIPVSISYLDKRYVFLWRLQSSLLLGVLKAGIFIASFLRLSCI